MHLDSGEWADGQGCCVAEQIGLHDDRRAWLARVHTASDEHDVTALGIRHALFIPRSTDSLDEGLVVGGAVRPCDKTSLSPRLVSEARGANIRYPDLHWAEALSAQSLAMGGYAVSH